MLKWNTKYRDGSKRKGNKFSDIDKDKLEEFILGGCSYNTDTGVFKIGDSIFKCHYVSGDNTKYRFMERSGILYNDLIHFNRAQSIQGYGQQLMSQNFGYKITYDIKGIQFHFKPILSLVGNRILMTIYIKPSKALEGQLVVNGQGIDFDLEKNGDNEITLEVE